MKFKTLSGRTKTGDITKYYVDWDEACRGKSKWGKFQYDIKQFLKKYWKDHIVCEEFPCLGTAGGGNKTLKIDLINFTRNSAIEVNGEQHRSYSPFFHGDRQGFFKQIERDARKSEWCELNDIDLYEIYAEDELSVTYFEDKLGIIL